MRQEDLGLAVLSAHSLEVSTEQAFAQTARVVSLAPDGRPLVQLPDVPMPVPARVAIPKSRLSIERALREGHPAVVVFEDGDRLKPIIVGFLEAQTPPVATAPAESRVAPPVESTTEMTAPPCVEADVDGKRVRVTAQDEIVLQCGSASITLRRNGRVVIRGTYVETRSEGTNRIKGGQVQIN